MKAVEFYRTFRSYIDYIFNKSESFLIPAYVNFLSLHTVYSIRTCLRTLGILHYKRYFVGGSQCFQQRMS